MNAKQAAVGFKDHNLKTQETLIQATSIIYESLPISSLDICFNKMTTHANVDKQGP
jgi:hypothetical protein